MIQSCSSALGQQDKYNLWSEGRDSIWREDVSIKVEQLVKVRGFLLTFETVEKINFFNCLDSNFVQILVELDKVYIDEILSMKERYQKQSLKLNRRMMAYAYLATDLDLDLMFFYPRTFSILVNEASLALAEPNISVKRRDEARKYLELLKQGIERLDLNSSVMFSQILKELTDAFPKHPAIMFNGSPTEKELTYHQTIDLLILLKRISIE
jgi:hypothetical protein